MLVSIFASLVFSLLDWKTGFASRQARAADQLDLLRYRGLYPPAGTGTDDDVKRLKAAGYKIYARRLYRELHGASLSQAVNAVDAM